MYNLSHPDTVTLEDSSAQRHIGLFLFDGIEELDAVGPWEVLAYWTRNHPGTAGPSRASRPAALAPTMAAFRHRLPVVAVIPEAPGVVPIVIEGRHLAELRAQPAQFFRWRFLARARG